MTKRIRIENADISNHPLRVQTYEVTATGQDLLIAEDDLSNPTDIAEFLVHPGRWLKVVEVPSTETPT